MTTYVQDCPVASPWGGTGQDDCANKMGTSNRESPWSYHSFYYVPNCIGLGKTGCTLGTSGTGYVTRCQRTLTDNETNKTCLDGYRETSSAGWAIEWTDQVPGPVCENVFKKQLEKAFSTAAKSESYTKETVIQNPFGPPTVIKIPVTETVDPQSFLNHPRLQTWMTNNADIVENVKKQICPDNCTDPNKKICYDYCDQNQSICAAKRRDFCTQGDNIASDVCTKWFAAEPSVGFKQTYWGAQLNYCQNKCKTDPSQITKGPCFNWSQNKDMIDTDKTGIKLAYDKLAFDYCEGAGKDTDFCACHSGSNSDQVSSSFVKANPYCFNAKCIAGEAKGGVVYHNSSWYNKKDCPNVCSTAINALAGGSIILNNISMIQNCSTNFSGQDASINTKIMEAVNTDLKANVEYLATLMTYLSKDLPQNITNAIQKYGTNLADAKFVQAQILDLPNQVTQYPDILDYPTYGTLNVVIKSLDTKVSEGVNAYNEIMKLDWTKTSYTDQQAIDLYTNLTQKFGQVFQGISVIIADIKRYIDDIYSECTRQKTAKANAIASIKSRYQDTAGLVVSDSELTNQLKAIDMSSIEKIVSTKGTLASIALINTQLDTIVAEFNNKQSLANKKTQEQLSSDIATIEGKIQQEINAVGQIQLNTLGFRDIPTRFDKAKAMTPDTNEKYNELLAIDNIVSNIKVTSPIPVLPNVKPPTTEVVSEVLTEKPVIETKVVDTVPKKIELPESDDNSIFYILIAIAVIVVIVLIIAGIYFFSGKKSLPTVVTKK